MGNIGKTTG